jgi:hypothetical protein
MIQILHLLLQYLVDVLLLVLEPCELDRMIIWIH